MRALLVIAHGSRSPEANEEVKQLTARISDCSAGVFDFAAHAFLEIAEPGIGQAVQALADAGAGEVMVFPYFLAAGTHVTKDVPRVIDEARSAHPGIRFDILPYLGALQGVPALIRDQIGRSGGG